MTMRDIISIVYNDLSYLLLRLDLCIVTYDKYQTYIKNNKLNIYYFLTNEKNIIINIGNKKINYL